MLTTVDSVLARQHAWDELERVARDMYDDAPVEPAPPVAAHAGPRPAAKSFNLMEEVCAQEPEVKHADRVKDELDKYQHTRADHPGNLTGCSGGL